MHWTTISHTKGVAFFCIVDQLGVVICAHAHPPRTSPTSTSTKLGPVIQQTKKRKRQTLKGKAYLVKVYTFFLLYEIPTFLARQFETFYNQKK